jgi:uncharacterized membrane protein YcfT
LRILSFMSWLGAHSIVVYLAFFFPMQVSHASPVSSGRCGLH